MKRRILMILPFMLIVWVMLASRDERREFMGSVKGVTSAVPRGMAAMSDAVNSNDFSFVSWLWGGSTSAAAEADDNITGAGVDPGNNGGFITADETSGNQGESTENTVRDPAERSVLNDCDLYDEQFRVIGRLRRGETVRLRFAETGNDKASVVTKNGTAGFIPYHELAD